MSYNNSHDNTNVEQQQSRQHISYNNSEDHIHCTTTVKTIHVLQQRRSHTCLTTTVKTTHTSQQVKMTQMSHNSRDNTHFTTTVKITKMFQQSKQYMSYNNGQGNTHLTISLKITRVRGNAQYDSHSSEKYNNCVSYVSYIHTSCTKNTVLDLFNVSRNQAPLNYSGQESKNR